MNGQVYGPLEQARLVEELVKTFMEQLCEKDTMDTIRPYVSGVHMEQLERLQRDYFYDERVMRGIRCTMGALTLPTRRGIHSSNRTMRILNRVQVLASGANGIASILGRDEETPLGLVSVSPGGNFVESKMPHGIIMKMSIDAGHELKREFVVGSILNSLRDYGIPHFAQVYGLLQCGSAFDDDMVCLHPGTNPLLLMEKIHGETMYKWMKHDHRSTLDVVLVLIQIMSALFVANRWFGFTHNDLHTDNVMIRTLPSFVYVPVRFFKKTILLKTRHIPVLIDYGYSRITIDVKKRMVTDVGLSVDPHYTTKEGYHRVALGTDLFNHSYMTPGDKLRFRPQDVYSTMTPFSQYLISDYYRLFSVLYMEFKDIEKLRVTLEFFFNTLKGHHIQDRFKTRGRMAYYLSQEESYQLENYAGRILRRYVERVERDSNRVVRTSERLDPNVPILACSEKLVKHMQSDPDWNDANLTGSCFTEDVFQEGNLRVAPANGAMPENLPLLVDAISHRTKDSLEQHEDVAKRAIRSSFQYINLPQWNEFLDSTIRAMKEHVEKYDDMKLKGKKIFDLTQWTTQMKKILHLYVLAYREYANRVFHLYLLNKLEHRHERNPRTISTDHTLEDYRQIDAIIDEDVESKYQQMERIIKEFLVFNRDDETRMDYSNRLRIMTKERIELRSSKYFKLTS